MHIWETVATMDDTLKEQVQTEYTDAWMQISGIVGTAMGLHEGKPYILIMTSADPDQIRPQIPRSVEGYPVIIENTGEFRAQDLLRAKQAELAFIDLPSVSLKDPESFGRVVCPY